MDERLRLSLWMVIGGGLGSVLGGAFGGLTGALYAQDGRSAGTRFGRRVADAFARTAQREASPVRRGAIVGAADGVLFLGIVGTLAGALMVVVGHADESMLGPAILGSVALVAAAAFFGVLAYAMTHRSAEFFSGVIGGILGSVLVGSLLGSVYGAAGLVPGMLVGKFFCRAVRRYSPKFHPPHVGKVLPPLPPNNETDILRPPHFRPDDDEY